MIVAEFVAKTIIQQGPYFIDYKLFDEIGVRFLLITAQ